MAFIINTIPGEFVELEVNVRWTAKFYSMSKWIVDMVSLWISKSPNPFVH
jgi:hypothetical protein